MSPLQHSNLVQQAYTFQIASRLTTTLRKTVSAKARRALEAIQSATDFGASQIRIVYCLTSSGNDLYEAMTVVSILTLRRTNSTARVTIVCDHQTHAALIASGSQLLAESIEILNIKTPEGVDGYRNRFLKTQLGLLIEGPFLFLDSDTVVRRSLSSLRRIRADIAAAPNHSHDNIKDQVWSEDQAHLQDMDWATKPTYFNAGVIWFRGTPASQNLSTTWHKLWLDSVQRSSRWRDQTAFNHALSKERELHIHCLEHHWNAQYWANPSCAAGARIWHTYATAGSMAERQRELFVLACQQVLCRAEECLTIDSAIIKALVSQPSPFRS